MPNGARLDSKGIIHNRYEGAQTAETIGRMVSRTITLIDRRHDVAEPVLILVDISKLGKLDYGARKQAGVVLKKVKFDRVAIFGGSAFLRQMVSLIIRGVRKQRSVKLFDSQSAAGAWLEDRLPNG